MKIQQTLISRWLTGAALLLGAVTASAHISYTNRDFGTIEPGAAPVTISNQTVTGNYGWADGTDADHGDSHKVRYYRFKVVTPSFVTLTFSGSDNGGTRDGSIKPALSLFRGLAHLAPYTNSPGSPDYDTSLISMAYRTSLGYTVEGCFHALKTWRIGGDNQPGPLFDFDAADGLSTFTYVTHRADGDATLFGSVPGIQGDGAADGTVTTSLFLTAGDYTVAVGGANYEGQNPTPDATVYGLVGTISATPFAYATGDPVAGGIGYGHQLTLESTSSGSFSGHVGAWSWEDDSLFAEGDPTVGWTHTSNWLALTVQQDMNVSITMTRDANVPWPSAQEPDRKADTSSMFPSFTLWQNWDNDGEDDHSYSNRGNVDWAEDLVYQDHVDNSTQDTITRTYFLRAGTYTLALGSNAPATNANRQGYKISFAALAVNAADPVAGGIGYSHTVVLGAGQNGNFSSHVGAWSWEDDSLFTSLPVGWTHTSNWMALKLTQEVFFTLTLERDANVPWPSGEEPDRKADTSSMFPSFTLYRGWDNDVAPASFRTRPDIVDAWAPYGGVPPDLGDHHTYYNRGNIDWAEDVQYVDHVDNSTADKITRVWRLPAGEYTLALGSNAPANNTLRQGYKATFSTLAPSSGVINGDPAVGGVGYSHLISVGRGDSGSFSNHVGAWSWEDNSLFGNDGQGTEPVGWTHTSRWLAVHVKDHVMLNLTMERDAAVPWAAAPPELNGMADTAKMNPSFTLYRGWDNDGSDFHTYNNRGNVSWAEDLTYVDHFNNSTAPTITRSYTLAPGYYTFALGSNADTTNSNRQGFRFSWTTSTPALVGPVISQQPKNATVLNGKSAIFSIVAGGPQITYQWSFKGTPIPGATKASFTLTGASLEDAGAYTCTVRNSAGWVHSQPANLRVIAKPIVDAFDLPDLVVGQWIELQLTAENQPTSWTSTALPNGLVLNPKTGLISGRPMVIRPLNTVTIKAMNAAGTSEEVSDTFAITGLATGLSSTYMAPIGRSLALNQLLGGRLQLTVTTLGSLSGSLSLGKADPVRISAPLDTSVASPTAQFSIPRPMRPALQVQLTLDAASKAIIGNISDGSESLPFTALQPLSAVGTYPGDYTVALKLSGADVGVESVPQGHGFSGFKINAQKMLNGVLKLADNSKVTYSGMLDARGGVCLFNRLYLGSGSVLGYVLMDATSGDVSASEVSWFKGPASTGLTYRDGFGPLQLTAIGRKYVTPAASALPMGLTAGTNNASITFAQGGAPDPATRLNSSQLTVLPGSVAIGVPNTGKVKVSIKKGLVGAFEAGVSGSFSGTFELTDLDTSVTPNKPLLRAASFQGMIVDDGTESKGYGYFLLPKMPTASPRTTLKTSPRLSGSVEISAN